MPFNLNHTFSYSKKKWYNKIWDTNIRYKYKRGNRNCTLKNKYVNKTWSEEDINQYWEKCSFKKFFSGLLLYRYRNIIPIVAPYNCWKEFLYIFILKGLEFRCYKDVFLVAYNHGSQIQKKVQNENIFVYNMIVE